MFQNRQTYSFLCVLLFSGLFQNCGTLRCFLHPEPPPPQKIVVTKEVLPKPIVGRVEWISIPGTSLRLEARIDTGAKTSSLHAENIQEKQLGPDLYVEFQTRNDAGEAVLLSGKVILQTKVTSANGLTEKRYVIRKTVRIGNTEETININLNDRSQLDYRFLAGRNLLMGHYLVDVSKSHVLGK